MLEEEPEQELRSKEAEEDIDGFLTYLMKIVEKP
jgi:hypothetical protein